MNHLKTLLIYSVWIYVPGGTTYELFQDIGEEYASEELQNTTKISRNDLEVDIDDSSEGSYEWDEEFSMRSGPSNNEKPMAVDVYYESLCPYSRKYIINQVEDASAKLKDFVDVNLIPFGNALITTTRDGEMEVYCQHGEEECIGNKIHACGMVRLPTNQEKIKFVSCVMKVFDPMIGGEDCSENFGLDWEQIKICSEGKEGDNLHYRLGEETTSLYPPIKGVPTTAINKVRGTDQDQRQMKEDLLGALCQRLRDMSVLPKECAKRIRILNGILLGK